MQIFFVQGAGQLTTTRLAIFNTAFIDPITGVEFASSFITDTGSLPVSSAHDRPFGSHRLGFVCIMKFATLCNSPATQDTYRDLEVRDADFHSHTTELSGITDTTGSSSKAVIEKEPIVPLNTDLKSFDAGYGQNLLNVYLWDASSSWVDNYQFVSYYILAIQA